MHCALVIMSAFAYVSPCQYLPVQALSLALTGSFAGIIVKKKTKHQGKNPKQTNKQKKNPTELKTKKKKHNQCYHIEFL